MKRCMGCMSEYGDELEACPVCGFSPKVLAEQREKFPEALETGTLLFGRYHLGRVLSYTDFSIIYNAWDSLMRMQTAVREFFPFSLSDRAEGSRLVEIHQGAEDLYREVREAFETEALTLFRNQDLFCMVNNYRVLRENGSSYIVMEYLAGECLGDIIRSGRLSALPADEIFALIRKIRESLREIHRRGILHLNLSPDAVYLTEEGNLKLVDFGLAKAVFYRSLAGETGVYEESFASPEILEEGTGTRESDYYSLGKILIALAEGRMDQGLERGKGSLSEIAALLTDPDLSRRRTGMDRLDSWLKEYGG